MKTHEMIVEGMSCGHCRSAVEKALHGIPDAEEVSVELEAGRARVTTPDTIATAEVIDAVEAAGYRARAASDRP
jgi:P-type Cu+ transporter